MSQHLLRHYQCQQTASAWLRLPKRGLGTWEVSPLQFSFKVGLGGMSYPTVKAGTVAKCTPSCAMGHRTAPSCLA